MAGIPELGELAGLAALKGYGYSDVEEIFYAAQVVGPEMVQLTGLPPTVLQSRLMHMINMLPAATQQDLEQLPCPLGVPSADANPSSGIAGPVPATPPASVNWITDLPPIRSQGDRGTCVAFAALTVLEHLLHHEGMPEDMSEQFLYWNCKQNDGVPNTPGTWLRTAFPLIARDGVCLETTWTYDPICGAREDGGAPPSACFADGLPYRRISKTLPPNSLIDLKAALAENRCVAFSIPVFRSWYRSTWVRAYGKVNMPLPNDILDGAHAMTLVGYDDSSEIGTGGGRFFFRNSWGTAWAPNSPHGAGYGSIPYSYLERHCMEAFTLERP